MVCRHFIAVAALAFASCDASAVAARVDFVYGEVTVMGTDGGERPLARGAELDNGHTVRTRLGRAQLRFTDGSYVSLQPNSEFAIRDYRFDGKTDGEERGFFGLAKGAMRTVTGLIGRLHRDRYQIVTPTATIGIRGTGGVIQVLEDGSTLVVGTSGIWSLTNPAGTVDVPAGVSARAPSTPDAPPQQSSQAPQAGPAPLVARPFTQGEARTPTGAPIALGETIESFKPLESGGGYAAATALTSQGFPPQSLLIRPTSASASFNAAGQLTELVYADGQSFKLDSALGAHANFGTDGVLAWGRWTGKVTGQFACSTGLCVLDKQYSTSDGLHYVIGLPTPVLPTSGTATYALLGASDPTYVVPTTGPRTFSGSLTVSFGAQARIDGQFSATMPDRLYAWTASGTTTSSLFSLTPTATSGCAISTCVITTQGFFAGTSAERAGIGYHIQDANASVIGSAAFKRQ